MSSSPDEVRDILLNKRAILVATIEEVSDKTYLRELLGEVDAALNRLSLGTYGTCETCHKPIDAFLLRTDPLIRYCSFHLSDLTQDEWSKRANQEAVNSRVPFLRLILWVDRDLTDEFDRTGAFPPFGLKAGAAARIPPTGAAPPRISAKSLRQRAVDVANAALRVFHRKIDHQSELDKDVNRASDVQTTMLPKCGLCFDGWETYYNFLPAGKVSGDYCDLVRSASTGDLFFFFGDAVGKGIAGWMIASQLHAVFRSLLSLELPMTQMFEHTNRLFCESIGPDYYATVVCGRASPNGNLEVVNAGHLPPFILRSGQAIPLPATGVPLGLFYTSTYSVTKVQLVPGETLVCYTDGITETRNGFDSEYGPERFASFVAERSQLSPEELVQACIEDVKAFSSNGSPADDRTLMALRHVERD